MHDQPTRPELILPTPEARCHRRIRETDRIRASAPHLRTNRAGPICEVLRSYRGSTQDALPSPSPLLALRLRLETEVRALEAEARLRGRKEQGSGPTIRLALLFLKGFGRVSSLDFRDVPIEERPELIQVLALEYRWCLAAAGTNARAFKLAIGRTGAR